MKTAVTQKERKLIHAMQTLGDTTRFKIFKLLLENQDYCVSDVAKKLNISVPAVSQHFKTFELVGLVDKTRNGQKICYQIKHDNKLVSQLQELII